MKKFFAFALALTFIFSLVGCSSGIKFAIPTDGRIVVCSGNNGTIVEVTDKENIRYITDNISALRFSKEKIGKNNSSCYTGWRYSLKFYDSESKLIEEILVLSEYSIEYKNRIYRSMDADAEIDLSFLDSLFMARN